MGKISVVKGPKKFRVQVQGLQKGPIWVGMREADSGDMAPQRTSHDHAYGTIEHLIDKWHAVMRAGQNECGIQTASNILTGNGPH